MCQRPPGFILPELGHNTSDGLMGKPVGRGEQSATGATEGGGLI